MFPKSQEQRWSHLVDAGIDSFDYIFKRTTQNYGKNILTFFQSWCVVGRQYLSWSKRRRTRKARHCTSTFLRKPLASWASGCTLRSMGLCCSRHCPSSTLKSLSNRVYPCPKLDKAHAEEVSWNRCQCWPSLRQKKHYRRCRWQPWKWFLEQQRWFQLNWRQGALSSTCVWNPSRWSKTHQCWWPSYLDWVDRSSICHTVTSGLFSKQC